MRFPKNGLPLFSEGAEIEEIVRREERIRSIKANGRKPRRQISPDSEAVCGARLNDGAVLSGQPEKYCVSFSIISTMPVDRSFDLRRLLLH
jgi:hypothetical protein